MGLGVAGLAVLGLSTLFIIFYQLYVVSAGGPVNGVAAVNGLPMEKAIEVLRDFLSALNQSLFLPESAAVFIPKRLTSELILSVKSKREFLRMT
jgi:K(+)-stimulated pyrophosphate-energized sodium pump